MVNEPSVFEPLKPLKFYCNTTSKYEDMILEMTVKLDVMVTAMRNTDKKVSPNDTFIFLLLSFEENKAYGFMWIHMQYQVLFSVKNSEKVFMNVVCCSRDWRFQG